MDIKSFNYTWRPAQFFNAGRPQGIKSILLHSTEGREAGDLQTLIGGDGRKVSVHWYITRSGKIYHMVQDGDRANHAGATNMARYGNSQSIGIEHEHFDSREDWPAAQIEASAQLLTFLMQKHGELAIAFHKDVAVPPGRKSDPVGYPLATVKQRMATLKAFHWSAVAV